MVVGRLQPLHDAVCRRPCVDQPQVMTEGFGLSGPLLSSFIHVHRSSTMSKKRKRISRRRLAGQRVLAHVSTHHLETGEYKPVTAARRYIAEAALVPPALLNVRRNEHTTDRFFWGERDCSVPSTPKRITFSFRLCAPSSIRSVKTPCLRVSISLPTIGRRWKSTNTRSFESGSFQDPLQKRQHRLHHLFRDGVTVVE